MKSKDVVLLVLGLAVLGGGGYAIYKFTQPATPTVSYKPDQTIFQTPTGGSSGGGGGFDAEGLISTVLSFF